MKEAIQKAIEGGYKQFNAPRKNYVEIDKALLDPLFWQALMHYGIPYDWKMNWHHLIDHLAEGKDIDSFFKELLV